MRFFDSRYRKNFILIMIFISLLPYFIFFLSDEIIKDVWYRVANLTGFIGAVLVLWQFILGMRGFSKWFTADYDWVIKIHTFLGINGAVFVLLHPILETIYFQRGFYFLFLPDFSTSWGTSITIGKFAIYLFLLIWFSSSVLRRTLQYRTWLYIHYLSYPMALFILIHPMQIGTLLLSSTFIYYYWLVVWFIFVLIFFLKFLDILCVTYKKYNLVEINFYPGDIFTLKYKPLKTPKVDIRPGQYFYIKTGVFSEAHPFSVLEFHEDTGEITFGIKKFGKFTKHLSESQVGQTHFIDGPFGEFTFEGQNNGSKIILAGGIGITPFYELISRYNTNETYLLYANKNLESALYREKFKNLLGDRYFDFVNEATQINNNVFCELISAESIRRVISKKDLNSFKFFICGSPVFTKSMISNLKSLGVVTNNIYIEEFEY